MLLGIFERRIWHESLVYEHPQDKVGGEDGVRSLGNELVGIFDVNELLKQLERAVKL